MALNCAALPEHLLESKSFDYKRGRVHPRATGDTRARRVAAEGALFLRLGLSRTAACKRMRITLRRALVPGLS